MFDMKNLARIGRIGAGAPAAMQAFAGLQRGGARQRCGAPQVPGAEALGVALTAQCGYSLERYRKAAIAAGASKAEIATVAAALRGGAALIHRTHLLGDCRHHHQGAEP
jgi:hypothetical protein